VEQALGQLESDEALRAEYEDLWSRQRTYPVWQYLAEAEEAEKAAHAAAAGGPQARARAWPPGAVLVLSFVGALSRGLWECLSKGLTSSSSSPGCGRLFKSSMDMCRRPGAMCSCLMQCYCHAA
jgi:hypothetical protein